MKALDSAEQGLHPMQYAMKICEDLGIPGQRTNLESISLAIESIAKGRLFRGRPRAIEEAFLWLHRRTMVAEEQGAKITHLWFRDGEYKGVEKDKPIASTSNCDSLCRAQHGRGYDWNDVMWVWKKYEREVAVGGTKTPEYFFKELDTKREGGPPSWR